MAAAAAQQKIEAAVDEAVNKGKSRRRVNVTGSRCAPTTPGCSNFWRVFLPRPPSPCPRSATRSTPPPTTPRPPGSIRKDVAAPRERLAPR